MYTFCCAAEFKLFYKFHIIYKEMFCHFGKVWILNFIDKPKQLLVHIFNVIFTHRKIVGRIVLPFTDFAHHGEPEFGSPKKPALVEAVALNFADNTDAKMETMKEIFKAAGEQNDWLGYNRLLESNIRKTSK